MATRRSSVVTRVSLIPPSCTVQGHGSPQGGECRALVRRSGRTAPRGIAGRRIGPCRVGTRGIAPRGIGQRLVVELSQQPVHLGGVGAEPDATALARLLELERRGA